MANTFITPSVLANAALAYLYENTIMAQLVYRDYDAVFANKVGDTFNVRKPATFTAQEFNRSAGISIQNATESSIPVVLNHFADVSFAATAEDLTLRIEDFQAQLLNPAMQAIAEKIDRDILLFRNDITQTTGGLTPGADRYTAPYAWSNPRALIAAGAILDTNNVPVTDRTAVVGPQGKAGWLADRLFTEADKRGDTAGLRNGVLGNQVFGFDTYMSQNVKGPTTTATGDPTTEVGVAFHKTAVALVTRPLVLPKGAAQAAIADFGGFGLRVVYAYDINKKQDVVSVDTLYGVKTMDPLRAVLIQGPLH